MIDSSLNFNIQISLEPVKNIIYSMLLIQKSTTLSGLNHWPIDTYHSLSKSEKAMHKLLFEGFYFIIMPEESWNSFPDYLEHFSKLNPDFLVDKLLNTYLKKARPLPKSTEVFLKDDKVANKELILKNEQNYLSFLRSLNENPENCCCDIDEVLEKEAYTLLIKPLELQFTIIKHLKLIWDNYLAEEWMRTNGIGIDSVNSFNQNDFSGMNIYEVIKYITDKECKSIFKDYTLKRMEEIKRFVFVPSPHVGPYIHKLIQNDTMWIFFGARMPSGSAFNAPRLDHQEIITKLTAIADSTRLNILKHLSIVGERSSVQIIQDLSLSQSAASRNLKQLSATGLLNESRGKNGKNYKINSEKLISTFKSVTNYLIPDS